MSDPITLTEAEREALICDCQDDPRDDMFCPLHADRLHFAPDLSAEYLLATVERILAARLAEVIEMGDHSSCVEAYSALLVRAERAEATLAEVRRTSRVLPCDGLCSDYAEEDCSLHGREPAELWEAIAVKNKRAEDAEAENARLRDTVARVEALLERMETNESARYCGPHALRAALAGGDS